MTDPIRELKTRAEILHKQKKPDGDAKLRLRDCLNIIATRVGFETWTQAKAAISGQAGVLDYGKLLYPAPSGGHINRWYTSYQEAAEVQVAEGGWLLAYKRQFLIVDRHFVESLGLDPEDPDWAAIGFNWVVPSDPLARIRLYSRLIDLKR